MLLDNWINRQIYKQVIHKTYVNRQREKKTGK